MTDRGIGALSLGLRALRRQLVSQPSIVASVFISVLVAAFLLAAAPRLLEHIASEDLLATVSEPIPAQRNIAVERSARIGAGTDADPMAPVRGTGDAFAESDIPPSVAAVTSGHYFVVDSPRFQVTPFPGEEPPHPFPMFLDFRYQDGVEGRLTLLEGSMPAPQAPVRALVGLECPVIPDERQRLLDALEGGGTLDIDCAIENLPHFQVAVSPATAEAMGIQIGTRMVMAPDGTDRSYFNISADALAYRFVMSISGIVNLTDPTDEYWYGDIALHRARIQENADVRIIRATGLMTPADYGAMLRTFGAANWNYTWRHLVDPPRVLETDLDLLIGDMQAFEQRFSPVTGEAGGFRVITQLTSLLRGHVDQRSETVSMMSMSLAGLFAVVVATILLLAVLMTARQRAAIVLARNRGASAGQLALTRLYEALLLSIPPALIGYAVAALFLEGTDHVLSYRVTVTLISAVSAVLVASALPLVTRRLGSLQSEATERGVGSSRRMVVDALVILLAVGAVFLLRRRGQIDDSRQLADFDALLAVAPALIGVAAGLVAVRAYPLVVGLLAWLGSKTRGLVLFVGFRRILQQSVAVRLPVLVVLICVAIAASTSVTRTSMTAGQQLSSWQVVGADYALKGYGPDVNLPTSIDFDTLGHDQIAFGTSFPNARATIAATPVSIQVMATDLEAYSTLTRGTPGETIFPSAMLAPSPDDAGSEAVPIPVIVSETWRADVSPGLGDVFTLDLGRLQPVVIVSDVRARHPDIPSGRPFVVLGRKAIETMSDLPVQPTVAYLAAPESAGGDLASTLGAQSTSARLISRYETLNSVAEDPFVRWARTGLLIVFWMAAIFGVGSAVASLALASSRRRTDFGHLRTMGLGTGQATSLAIIEQLPALLVGSVVGALVGVGTAVLLGPGIDLDAFTGGVVAASVVVDWAQISWIAAGLMAMMTTAVVIFVSMSRGDDLGRILRVGDE
jgi:putative ABC transport system permease protein